MGGFQIVEVCRSSNFTFDRFLNISFEFSVSASENHEPQQCRSECLIPYLHMYVLVHRYYISLLNYTAK